MREGGSEGGGSGGGERVGLKVAWCCPARSRLALYALDG